MPGGVRHRGAVAGVAAAALIASACSDGNGDGDNTASTTPGSVSTSVSVPTVTDPGERSNLVAVHDVSTECVDGQPVLGIAVGVSDQVDVRVEVVHDGRVLGEESAAITPENQPLLVPVRLVSLPEKPTPTPEIHIWADVRPGPVINVTPVDLALAESVCG